MTARLPPTLDAGPTSKMLGISKWALYELVKKGECPVPVLHIGRSIKFPTRPLADALGLDVEIVVAP